MVIEIKERLSVNNTTLIFLIFSTVLLFLPLYESLKKFNKTVKLFSVYFAVRILVEFFGFSVPVFNFPPHIYYHFFALAEFIILSTIIKRVYCYKKSFDIIRISYLIIWLCLHIFDLGEISESFFNPVGLSVWINATFFITFCGFRLVNYNYQKGIKDPLMLFNLSILVYFLSIIFFVLNKSYIHSSYMKQAAKIAAINEIIKWQAVLVSVSTVIYYFAIKYMPEELDKKLKS